MTRSIQTPINNFKKLSYEFGEQEVPQTKTEILELKSCILSEQESINNHKNIDNKILLTLGLPKGLIEQSPRTLYNTRNKLISELHKNYIKLFKSYKDEDGINHDKISSYVGLKNENLILLTFIQKFGEKIINKENYKKAIEGKDYKSLLNKDWKNNKNLIQNIKQWFEKENEDCKKVSK